MIAVACAESRARRVREGDRSEALDGSPPSVSSEEEAAELPLARAPDPKF
ncbi:hypothetical protein ACWGJT_19100 [Streptomyces xantholiticus]